MMRTLFVLTCILLTPPLLWGQEASSDHRFWIGQRVALMSSSPENFSASRCTTSPRVLGAEGGGFIGGRVFAAAGVTRTFGGNSDCVIQLDPWENPAPPPPDGTWTRDYYGPDESVLGNDYVAARLQLGIELARSITGRTASIAIGPAWIPSKDLLGLGVSGQAGLPLIPSTLNAVFRVDVDWMSVPYRVETREYVDGVVMQSTAAFPTDRFLGAAVGLGLEYRFGHR